MKKYIIPIFLIIIFMTSCSKTDSDQVQADVKSKVTCMPTVAVMVSNSLLIEKKHSYDNTCSNNIVATKSEVEKSFRLFQDRITIETASEKDLRKFMKNALDFLKQEKILQFSMMLQDSGRFSLAIDLVSNLMYRSSNSIQRAVFSCSLAYAYYNRVQKGHYTTDSPEYIQAKRQINNAIDLLEDAHSQRGDEKVVQALKTAFLYAGELALKYENNVDTVLNLIERNEDIINAQSDERQKSTKEFVTDHLYYRIGVALTESDNIKDWHISQNTLQKLQSYADTLPPDKMSPMFKWLGYDPKKMQHPYIKGVITQALKRYNEEEYRQQMLD